MKRCYLDANVLISYKNEDSPFFGKAKRLIKSLIRDSYEAPRAKPGVSSLEKLHSKAVQQPSVGNLTTPIIC